ncbi:hypothetical protein GCM10023083_79540 [Streptomyces phyllanthi]
MGAAVRAVRGLRALRPVLAASFMEFSSEGGVCCNMRNEGFALYNTSEVREYMNMPTRGLNHSVTGGSTPCNGAEPKPCGTRDAPHGTRADVIKQLPYDQSHLGAAGPENPHAGREDLGAAPSRLVGHRS